ncbi:MAG TPA: hypothetical protein VGP41_08250 [Candidatus Lustribacter sp.]|nr:hypothetical protein [Candidatus Lustribacter sp.]
MLQVIAFLMLFPISLAVLALAYVLTIRLRKDKHDDEPAEAAFGLGQAAIFGLIALILGFSFAFASERYEARRALVVDEGAVASRTYSRADFLPTAERAPFRRGLHDYVEARLDLYDFVTNAAEEDQTREHSQALWANLWAIANRAALRDPRNNLTSALAADTLELNEVAEQQAAALDNHVPAAIIGLDLFCTVAGSLLLGVTFGRVKSPNFVLSIIFCLLFAATVFTIVDLDNGKRGFIRLETAPLQDTLGGMRP